MFTGLDRTLYETLVSKSPFESVLSVVKNKKKDQLRFKVFCYKVYEEDLIIVHSFPKEPHDYHFGISASICSTQSGGNYILAS